MARSSVVRKSRRGFLVTSLGALAACRSREERRATQSALPSAASAVAEVASPVPSVAALADGALEATYPLFDAFPGLAAHLPRAVLGRFPSRVESAATLARDIAVSTLLVKRDDDVAELYGGGKVRKLELYLGEALAQGKKTVVTFGGVGSNQAVATALFGRALGLDVRLYLAPQPASSLVTKNLGADAASSATLRLFPSVSAAEAHAAREAKRLGPRDAPYLIAPGGTTPLGTLGFVSGGLELAHAVSRGEIPAPARVVVALGLGGTAAGIALGCALGGLDCEIVAVRASNPTTVSLPKLRSIAADAAAFAHALDPTFPSSIATRLRIEGRFVGAGYGAPTREGDAAIVRARADAGWELDPVYTGKAFAALIADASTLDGPVLFWNTQSSRPLHVAPVPDAFRRFVAEG